MHSVCKPKSDNGNTKQLDERFGTNTQQSMFGTLPEDIVRDILAKACAKEEDVNQLSRVCRKWREYGTSKRVWRNVKDRCEFTGARFRETIFTWGHERFGVLGNNPISNEAVPNPIEMSFFRGRHVRKIGCGGFYASVLLDNGTFYVVGDNTFCQHGSAKISKEHIAPTKIELDFIAAPTDAEKQQTSFLTISNGYAYMLGMKQDEVSYYDESGVCKTTQSLSLWGWGTGHFGTMLDGENRDAVPTRKLFETRLNEAFEDGDNLTVPRLPATLNLYRIKKIACGDSMVIALTNDYHVFSWGSNTGGRLGTGREDSDERYPPELIQKLEGKRIVKIACGGGHSLALSETGKVYSWGSGGVGATAGATLEVTGGAARLGHGENPPICSVDRDGRLYLNRPAKIRSIVGRVKQISCGQWHSLLLLENGRVMVFGGNSFGQLGVGHERTIFVPTVSPFLSFLNARKIIGGRLHSGALTQDGRVFTWGCGLDGQLGNGKLTNSCIPVLSRIPERFFATKLAIGKFQTMVAVRLRSDCSCEDNKVIREGLHVSRSFTADLNMPTWGDDLPGNGARDDNEVAAHREISVTMDLPMPHGLHILRSPLLPSITPAPPTPPFLSRPAAAPESTIRQESQAQEAGRHNFAAPRRSSILLSAFTRHRRHRSLGAINKKTQSIITSPSPLGSQSTSPQLPDRLSQSLPSSPASNHSSNAPSVPQDFEDQEM